MAYRVSYRCRIPAPAAAAWDMVADPFRRPEWMAFVVGVGGEPLADQPGPAERRFSVEGRLGPFRFTAREKVTAVWPGTMVAFHGEVGSVSYLLTLTLSEVDGENASLAWNMEVRPVHDGQSLPARLGLFLAWRIADCLARLSLANLRLRLGA